MYGELLGIFNLLLISFDFNNILALTAIVLFAYLAPQHHILVVTQIKTHGVMAFLVFALLVLVYRINVQHLESMQTTLA